MTKPQTPFFGRVDELTALHQRLADPTGKAVLIVGPAGMGKTSLIEQFINEAEDSATNSCVTMSFKLTRDDESHFFLGMMMQDIEQAIQDNASFFSVTPRGRTQLAALMNLAPKAREIRELFATLRAKKERHPRDEFIQLLRTLSELLPDEGRIVIAIDANRQLHETSADTWRIIIEQLPPKAMLLFGQRPDDVLAASHELRALPNVHQVPDVSLLHALTEDESEECIDWAAGDLGITYNTLAPVLNRYEGHPYALMAAIGLLRDGVGLDDLPVDPTPERIAEAQWNQVKGKHGTEAMRLFKAHTVIEVPATDAFVRHVAKIDADTHESLLAGRFIESLLRREGNGRTVYHAILRDHILDQLDEEQARPYHDHAAEKYRAMLTHAKEKQIAPDPIACSRAHVHMERAEGVDAAIVVFVNECTPALITLGLLDVIIQTTRCFLEVVVHETEAHAVLLGNLGLVMQIRGDLDGAEAMLRKALEIDEKLGHLAGMANQYGNLGLVMQTRGDLDGAEAMLRKALQINEQLGRLEGMASQYGNLGLVMQTRGDLDGAEAMHRKALEINKKLGRLEGMANQYGNLGLIMEIRSNLDEAEVMYRKAIQISKKRGHLEGMAIGYGNLGNIMQLRGELDGPGGAEAMYRKSLELNEKLGRLEGMANAYGNLGIVMEFRGDLDCPEGAEGMFRKALQINEQLGHLVGMAKAYGNLGIIMQTRGDLDGPGGAEAMQRKALELNEKLGRLEGMANQYGNLGTIMQIRGDFDRAREHWIHAQYLFAQLGAQHMVAKTQGLIDELPVADAEPETE